jgi:prepilin-type processing-associated H-X9-DG protein
MAIQVTCPQCGASFSVPDAHAGEHGKCPQCGTLVHVGAGESEHGTWDQNVAHQPPTYRVPYQPPESQPQLRSGLAIASLICGIIGMVICLPLGVAGIIMGIIALTRINREPRVYAGQGMAIAGICTGAVGLLMLPLIFLPALSRARELSKRLVCASNLTGISTSCQIHANDHDGAYPPDLQALLDSGDVTPKGLVCPSSGAAEGDITASYIYIPGQTGNDDPRNVLVYEKEENHAGEGANVLFLDGHTKFIKPYSEVEDMVEQTRQRLAALRAP